ncbi:hypothetical protein TrCOL_g11440 [Triparma columacea]|uniref:MYND-type domain-containing protein n=1 Tax=Triparma columacea TaxID=722753 RepID=A0A9W7LE47_9STRA|nr:hypothetical protein TrCOL_g11440 [Triparma columacea]
MDLEVIIGQMWRQWFVQPVPALEDMTPTQAATTAHGRSLLESLFSMYNGYDGYATNDSNLTPNVPPPFARWKLGFGPGSAEEFREELMILSKGAPMAGGPPNIFGASQPNSMGLDGPSNNKKKLSSQSQLLRKQSSMFTPQRCELPGCLERDVKKCSSCRLAFYCCIEHQKADWARHKKDCKHLKKSNLRRKYFTTAKELEKFPLGCFPLPPPPKGTPLKCFVCGATESEVDIQLTECCGAPICDNEGEYQMFSYSRDFCARSHRRYTRCAAHSNEGHSGDWRDCERCDENMGGGGANEPRCWYSTNGFNLTPGLESRMPQGMNITKGCDGCGKRITPGHDQEQMSFSAGKTVVMCGYC